MKTLNHVIYLLITFSLIFSCSKENESIKTEIIHELNRFAKESSFDIEINSTVPEDEAIILNDIDELKSFINEKNRELDNLKKSSSKKRILSAFANKIPCPDNHGIYTSSVNIGPITQINFTATFNHGTVTNFSTSMSGFTLGTSYTQNAFSVTSQNLEGTNMSTTGFINYNLFVEGVGTVYRQRTKWKVSSPCGGAGGQGQPLVVELE